MKTITLEVPDDVAERVAAASDAERKILADRFATLVTGQGRGRNLETVFDDIRRWQTDHGVPSDDFDQLFSELADED